MTTADALLTVCIAPDRATEMTADRPDAAARWFVRLVTLGMCLAAGWMVATQGTSALPVQDEWFELGEWCRRLPGEWVFRHHNEHRYPLGRLVWITSLHASGFNFRVPMYLSVGLLTAAAVLLQWTARRLRGHAHPLDAVSAVLLLHWGHTFNLLMGYQVAFTLFAYAIAGWVWCGVNWSADGRARWAWGSAAYAASLAFAGGFGLAVTPVVAGWLGYLGVACARRRRWAHATGFVLLAAGVIGYTGWVSATMPASNVERLDPVRQAERWLIAAADFLSGATGFWGLDREGGWVRGAVTIGVLAVYAAAAWSAGQWVFRRQSGRRAAGVLLLTVLAGVVGVALAVGLARPSMALGGRFTTPSAVGLAAALVAVTAVVRTGPRLSAAAAAGVALFAIALQVQTFKYGHELGVMIRSPLGRFRSDLLDGNPPVVLAGRYGGTFGVLIGADLPDSLPRFKRARLGIFAGMADDPPHVPVPVEGAIGPQPTDPPTEGGRTLTLPTPPPGAFAVRIRMERGPVGGGHQHTCLWTDPVTSKKGQSVAHAHWLGWAETLVFTFDGRPMDLVVTGFRREPPVGAIEWLVATP